MKNIPIKLSRSWVYTFAIVVNLSLEGKLNAFGPHIHISVHISPPHISIPNPVPIVKHDADVANKIATHAATTLDHSLAPVVHDIPKVTTTVTSIQVAVIDSSKNLTKAPIKDLTKEVNNLGDKVDAASENVRAIANKVAKPLANGVKGAASDGEHAAKDIKLIGAHIELIVTDEVKGTVKQEVADVRTCKAYAVMTVADIGSGRFGHATQDISKTVLTGLSVASFTGDAQQDAHDAFSHARDAVHADLEAIEDVRSGHFGDAAEAMGRSLTAAGTLVSDAGEPDIGSAINQAGQNVETETPYAEHMTHDLRQMDISDAARQAVESYIQPEKTALTLSKSAVQSAKDGKFGDATLQATMAVALLTGATTNSAESTATEASILSAKAALDATKEGRFGAAGQSVGDALSSAGQAINATDPNTGQELENDGETIHEYAANLSESAAEVRQQ